MITPTELKINEILDEKPGPRMLSCGEAMAIADLLLFDSTYPFPIIPKIANRLATPEIATIVRAMFAFFTITVNRDNPSEEQKRQLYNYIHSLLDTFSEAPKFDSYRERSLELSEDEVLALINPYVPVFQEHFFTNRSAVREYQKRHPKLFSPAVDYRLASMALTAYFRDQEENESLLMLIRADLYINGA